MLRVVYDELWPESWKLSYLYDDLEIGGSRRDLGYSYQYQIRREWSLRSIQELVPVGGTILDVAGGSGNFALPLSEMGYHVTWNDLRSELAGFVKLKYEFGEVEFASGNIFDFAVKWAGRFDGILAAEIIEHVAHPDNFLVCLASMLKPGGWLFLTTPNGRYFRNNHPRFSDCADPSVFESTQFKPNADGHIFLLDRDECRMTNPLSCGHIKLGHLLNYLPASTVEAVEAATGRLPRALGERINSHIAACLRKPK
jgi:2-polyprenyl-6-hydroxyphenyl methylase/3-demethylubiquinone-9 3-methyltransferase